MLSNELANKYAKAVFELAVEEEKLQEVENDLKFIVQTISLQQDLSDFIYHPHVKLEAKKEIFTKIFIAEIGDLTNKFMSLLFDKKREMLLPQIVGEFEVLANEAQNIIKAQVIVATALNVEQRTALINKLSMATGKTVVAEYKIDTGILGGVIVKIGDKLIDGSVIRQLETLKTQLLADETTKIGVNE